MQDGCSLRVGLLWKNKSVIILVYWEEERLERDLINYN